MDESSSSTIWDELKNLIEQEFPADQWFKVNVGVWGDGSGALVQITRPGFDAFLLNNALFRVFHLGTVASGSLYVSMYDRNKGYAQRLMNAKIAWAKQMNLRLMAAVHNNNAPQIRILQKYGWDRTCSDMNESTIWVYTPRIKE